MTSVFGLFVGLERIFHLDQMQDAGFALLRVSALSESASRMILSAPKWNNRGAHEKALKTSMITTNPLDSRALSLQRFLNISIMDHPK